MMKAILVDDELYCTEVLSALLTKHCPEVDIIAELNDPHRAVDFYSGKSTRSTFSGHRNAPAQWF